MPCADAECGGEYGMKSPNEGINMNSEIINYQNQKGNINIDVRLKDETAWLTQEQMLTLF